MRQDSKNKTFSNISMEQKNNMNTINDLINNLELDLKYKIKRKIKVSIKNKMKYPIGENNRLTIDQIQKDAGRGDTNSIYLKHVPNLYVIDFDTKDCTNCTFFNFLIDNNDGYTMTTKGYHFYVYIKNINKFKNQQKVLKQKAFEVDLLKTNNCWEPDARPFNGSLKLNTYDWNEINKYFDVNKMNFTNKDKKINQKELDEIANLIDIKYLDNYNDWCKIVWALASEQQYDLSISISSKSTKFNLDSHDKIYNQANKKTTIATVYHYAKLSNKEDFYNVKEINDTQPNVPYSQIINNTDYDLADLYLKLKSDNIVKTIDNDIYIYQYPFWVKDNNKNLIMKDVRQSLVKWLTKSIIYYNKLKLANIDDEDKMKAIDLKIKFINTVISSVNSHSKQKNIVEQLLVICDNTDIKFDLIRPNIFCFKDKFFDLISNEQIEIKKEDYISHNTGYDYVEPTQNQMDKIHEIVYQIMPDPEKLKCLLSLLKSLLSGNKEPYLVLFNGTGSNGKGWFIEFLEKLMGADYFVRAKKEILTVRSNRGASTDLVKMDKKRACIFSEPEEDEKLNCGILKEYTDTPTTEARGLYQNLRTIYFSGFLLMECNQRPVIRGRADYAILRRIIDLEFSSSFVTNPAEVDEENHYYLKKKEYKDDPEFVKNHMIALFHYIIKNGANEIYIPDVVKSRGEEYIVGNDELLQWFDTDYEITDDKKDYVTLKDLYSAFKLSDIWNNLDKNERRTNWNAKNFKDNIQSNIKLRKYFKEVVVINKKKIRTVLTNVKLKETEDMFCASDSD